MNIQDYTRLSLCGRDYGYYKYIDYKLDELMQKKLKFHGKHQ